MKLKRPAAILCTLALAAGGITAVAANQGTEGDPLLTLSYLDKVLRPQLETQVDQAVEKDRAELVKQLELAVTGYENRVKEVLASAQTGSAAFQSKSLAKGESFTPGAGRELLLTSGSATALGSLTDTTAGKSVQAGDKLETAHLYLTASDAAGCKADAAATIMSR